MKLIKRFFRFIDKKIIVPITKFFVSIGEKLKLSDNYSIPVIKGGDISVAAYTGDGEMINSGFLNGIDKTNRSIC